MFEFQRALIFYICTKLQLFTEAYKVRPTLFSRHHGIPIAGDFA